MSFLKERKGKESRPGNGILVYLQKENACHDLVR